jgi:hypothetical protein
MNIELPELPRLGCRPAAESRFHWAVVRGTGADPSKLDWVLSGDQTMRLVEEFLVNNMGGVSSGGDSQQDPGQDGLTSS